ncbi:MAG: hypothetical protein VYE22_06880 [Myxococcota bacterium]|nr:hypothetical protein [Myxococcota bacterium]
MSALSRTLYVPVAAVRPYLALKCTLILLAFDVWIARLYKGHGHGAGGFNVAHFGLLDAVQPSISAPLYVGVIVLTGALCLTIAIASRPPRALIVLAFLLHTWSWAMSMLDSYQHHYLLSIVLLALAFFPRLTAEEALLPPSAPVKRDAPGDEGKRKRRKKKQAEKKKEAPEGSALLRPFPLVSAGGYAFLAASVAVVYAYTALSKTDPEWLAGAALKSVLHLQENGMPAPGRDDPISFFRELAASFGLAGETFWWFMGHSVVGVQLVCALGYLLAPFRDVTTALWMHALGWLALFTALSFHLGAEYMGLEIGWFSYYMIGYALIFFLPGRWLVIAARALVPLLGASLGPEVIAARILAGLVLLAAGFGAELPVVGWLGVAILALTPIRLIAKAAWTREAASRETQTHHVALGAAGIGAAVLVAGGYIADMPGAPAAAIAGAVLLGAGVVYLLVAKGQARAIHGYGVGAAIAGLALIASMALSETRWDFYRNYGGNHRRLGEWAIAYHAYQKAVRYAPDDDAADSRQRRVDEMRANIERDGPRRP